MLAITHLPSPKMESGERTFLGRAPIDHELALYQHAEYCRVLESCGAKVQVLSANLALPDCAFVEDATVILDELAIICPMGAESRRAEIAAIETEVRKYRELERIELPATLEGGDVLRIGKTLFVGRSSRSSPAGINLLDNITQRFGYQVLPIALRECLHLKTACCALPNGQLLVSPVWIDVSTAEAFVGFDRIPVPQQEPWGANVLVIDQSVVIDASHARTADLIESLGFSVRRVDLSEFAKAEAGVTCLSLLFA